MKVVVTGSLGNVSKPLAKQLVEKGHSVTVISSKKEKQRDIEALGAHAAIGSVEDLDFLVSIFNGADAVYVMVPPRYDVADPRAYYAGLGRKYADAIEQTGVKRVVHMSSVGAHLAKGTGVIAGLYDNEHTLNEKLLEKGVSLVHLRPVSFYTNFFHHIETIKAMGVIGANYGGDDKLRGVSLRYR